MEMLDKINSPEDVKKLSLDEMKLLAQDIRKGIIKRVNDIGGHLGPDLGIVEATIALHYVFNSPKDKFIFDVSHQCYPHKMITGRKDGFINKNYEITKTMNNKIVSPVAQRIFDITEDITSGRMICGAGNGGFIEIILKKRIKKQEINKRLQKEFVNTDVEIWKVELE